MGKVRTHKFNGVRYSLVVGPFFGICDSPRTKGGLPQIILPLGLPEGDGKVAKEGLFVLVHEALHASNWDLAEETVERMGRDLSTLLWRLGYRRQDEAR